MRRVGPLPPTVPSESTTARLGSASAGARSLIWATLILWLAALAVFVRGLDLNSDFLHDDAFITLRYAQNLLAGNGIGWNPGDRVEGYTNFLQLMAASALGALGVDLVRATRALAAVSYAATLVFLAFWLVRSAALQGDARDWLLASLPLAACASSLPLLAWGFGGLEAPLLTLWVTVGLLLVAGIRDTRYPEARAVLGGFALALASMTRPDAALFVALAGGLIVLPAAGRIRWSIVAYYVAAVTLLIAPWLLWKLAYYGSILPNTFYVKATDPSIHRIQAGLAYIGSYVAAPPFGVLLLIVGMARSAAARRLSSAQLFVALGLAGHVSWVCFIGGDQMPVVRLLVPIIPAVAWLCFDLWLPDLRRLTSPRLCALAVGVGGAIVLQLAMPGVGSRNLNSTAFVGAAVGDYISGHWQPGSLVALNTAGSTPYHAPGFRYVDMLGLNDAHIARRDTSTIRIRGQLLPGHAKGDGAYVLDQQPDYIILGPAHGALAHQPWFLSDLEIAEDPRFRAGYVKRQTRVDVTGLPKWELFPETASGDFLFSWYERRSVDR
jgi:arabinofuranosyltransferase